MDTSTCLALQTTSSQTQQLQDLQRQFAQVCNALAPQVAGTRVWSRVALHHMHYRALREAFPQLGSQMVCNAIYAVSRAARLVYQHPTSPLHHKRLPAGPLPVLRFAENGPVFFDRHTLSARVDGLSLYTLQGRIRIDVVLPDGLRQQLQDQRLLEVVLEQADAQTFTLTFRWEGALPDEWAPEALPAHLSVLHEAPQALSLLNNLASSGL